jgi:succinyl-CoA synthetase beta subunit
VLEAAGLEVPRRFGLLHTPEDLEKMAPAFPAMIKAQVLIGGRG